VIVSNTTPLSSLLKIGKTHLLRSLYGTLSIPPEVAAELDQSTKGGANNAASFGWLSLPWMIQS
jgi:predicted nucleic acid-binding protein